MMLCIGNCYAQEVTLDFTNNSWGIPSGSSNKIYKKTTYSNGNYSIILSGTSKSKGFYFNTGGYLVLEKTNASLTFPSFDFDVERIEVIGRDGASYQVKLNIYVGSEAVSTEKTGLANLTTIIGDNGKPTDELLAKTNSFVIKDGYQTKGKIYVLKILSDHVAHITAIKVYKKVSGNQGSSSIVIGTNEGYGTYYSDVNYVLPDGLIAYGYTNINAGGVLTKSDKYVAGDVIPANTAVMVEGNKGTYNFNATDMAATKTIEGNLLKGVTETTTIEKSDDVSRYVLTYVDGVLGFYKTSSGNIKVQSNRAYLEIPNVNAVSCIFLGGESTGVELNKITPVSSGIYTLSGVLLKERDTKKLPAGLYIQNGKVIIIK